MKTNDSYAGSEINVVANAHNDKKVLPNLDGIRAAACLIVVLSHTPLLKNLTTLGSIGVGVFYALSGFLMSYLYARERWNLKSVCFYGIARFSRIAPVYWLVVSICIIISYMTPQSDFSMRIMGATQILRHYFFGGSVGVFWSIPSEIQYYIFFLLVWFAIAQRAVRTYVLPMLALLCSGFFLSHNLWPGLALPHMLHFFLAGSIAGLIPRGDWDRHSEKTILPFLQIVALLLLFSPVWLYTKQIALYAATELGVVFAFSVYLLSIPSNWTTFVFASPLMRRIGQASFSIYLMHLLVFHFGMLILGLSVTQYDPLWFILIPIGVVLPMIASHYLEIPLQKLTRKFLLKRFQPWLQKKEILPVLA